MTILYKIKDYLHDNFLTIDNTNDFIAHTVRGRSLNMIQICDTAFNRKEGKVTAATIELF
ncbi:hypothetical protein J2Y40_000092 [Chryseobacterium sp. 2987]|uniref:hypothetical protein n=1 Tax=Chryseobacterium sp. NRRL B-14798 TaxID=3162880 RepID=UPI00285C36BD|nr:hypothetical protein [Chryseobacterium sp. 2987]